MILRAAIEIAEEISCVLPVRMHYVIAFKLQIIDQLNVFTRVYELFTGDRGRI